MLFWIFAAVILVALVLWIWWAVNETLDYESGWFAALIIAWSFIWRPFVAGVVALLALLMTSGIGFIFNTGAQQTGEDTYSLRALASSEATEGRVVGSIFLTVGTLSEKPVISYIREDGRGEGGMRLERVGTTNATIYEDSADPEMTIYHWSYGNPWLSPLPGGSANSYSFHVPEGSVARDFEVKP